MNTTCRFFTFLFASTLAGCAAQSGDEPAASDDAEIQASTPQLSLFEEGSLAYVHQKALPSESGDGWIAFVDEKAGGQSDFLTADFVAVGVEDGKTVRHPLVTWSKGLEGNAAGLKASQSFLAGRKWK